MEDFGFQEDLRFREPKQRLRRACRLPLHAQRLRALACNRHLKPQQQ